MGFGGSIGHAISHAAKSVAKKSVKVTKKSTGLAVTAAAAYSAGTTGGLSTLATKNTAVRKYGIATGTVEAPIAAVALATFTGGLSSGFSDPLIAEQQSLLNPAPAFSQQFAQAGKQVQVAVLDPISQFFSDLLGIFT